MGAHMMDLQAARYLMKGEVPKSAGNNHPTGIPMGRFNSKDGYVVFAGSNTMFPRFCKAMDLEYLIDHPDYNSNDGRSENRDALNAIIQEHFMNFTSAEITDKLMAAGVPCGPVNTVDQTFADPQVKHLKMRRPQEHPILGKFDVVGTAINLSKVERTEEKFPRHTPEMGEHNDEVLSGLGYSEAEIQAMKDNGIL
jgi:formyl-CoA transferase